MKNMRKTIKEMDAAYIVSLMQLIETQSKETLLKWTSTCVKEDFLPILEKENPMDECITKALAGVDALLNKDLTLKDYKTLVREVNKMVKEVKDFVPLLALRAIHCALAVYYTPTHGLGMVLYGVVALEYDQLGVELKEADYKAYDAKFCAHLESKLKAIAIENEVNPVKIDWHC